MIKCEVIENFTLEKYNQLKNVNKREKRKDNEFGIKDTFECSEEMVDYLTGNNVLNKTVVKVVEVEPIKEEETPKEEIIEETKVEEKPKKKKHGKK